VARVLPAEDAGSSSAPTAIAPAADDNALAHA
jgi:hypothetical protein